jgi:hypothetical protein
VAAYEKKKERSKFRACRVVACTVKTLGHVVALLARVSFVASTNCRARVAAELCSAASFVAKAGKQQITLPFAFPSLAKKSRAGSLAVSL